jgi:hypothetical protein
MIPSEKIFGAFESKRLLCKIATQRCINVLDDKGDRNFPKSEIIKILSEDVRDVGFTRMLKAIKLKELKSLGEIISKQKEEDRIATIKRVLEKKIKDHTDEVGQEVFFNSVPSIVKKEIINTLDLEVPNDPKEYTQAILDEAESIGQDYFFSSFSTENLAKFATSCGLDVDSLSQNVLVDCIMNLQSYKAPKRKPTPKPSKKKPEKITKGIAKIDLEVYYSKDELVEYCKTNKIPISGNKRDLIAKILAHIEGREIPLPKGKKRRKKKSDKETEKKEKKEKRSRETISSGEASPQKKKKSIEVVMTEDSSSEESLEPKPKKKINKSKN